MGILVEAAGASGGAELVDAGGGGHPLFHQQGRRETACGELAGHATGKRHVSETNKVQFPVVVLLHNRGKKIAVTSALS